MTLSKTDYILYRECPKNVWVKKHKPEEYGKFEISEFEKSLGVMGNEVEALARGMFPGGFLIERRSEGARELTQKLIAERTPVIFQPVFVTDKYLAAADVLKWNDEAQKYDIYEIKMSTQDDSEYEYDIAFQSNVIESCGVPLHRKYLVRLNSEYVRGEKLNFLPGELFLVEDKTEAVDLLRPAAAEEMERAQEYLSREAMPDGPCPCYYKGRNSHCTAFTYINPTVPTYSVHDLNRIGNSKKYLEQLLSEGVLEIGDVPIDDRLKAKKLNQVLAHQSQEPLIDRAAIKAQLDSLVFPFYFLDYETYPTAIPPYTGYHPYQHIVFQYSLHVLRAKDAEPEHFECLVLDGEPSERIAKSLREHIGATGTVISWFKTFENSRNRELAGFLPDYADFFNDVIARTYDLMDIVEGQHYVHPGFKGRASIKNVLPVVAPHLSYKKLGVQNGTDAIEAYRQITSGELTGEAATAKHQAMLEYCKLDTYAMYTIWHHLAHL